MSKATWKVSAAVMASRVLGLIREMLFASIFGGSRWMDCFLLAFRIPNLMRDLFAEGALSQAFVTTFSKKLKTEGEDSAWKLAHQMFTLAAVFMSLICIVGILTAPWIVELLTSLSKSEKTARTYSVEETQLIITMVRIMYPFILLVSLAALAMGLLNARKIFGMPALASCFFNIGSMIGGASIGYWMDPNWGPKSLIGFSWGVLIGGAAQLICQFPALRKTGFHWAVNLHWNNPNVKQILKLMAPAVIAASVVQINVVVNSMFAYGVSEGAVSWLNYAFRLMQLPIGVFGVAIGTVTLPALSRAAIDGIGKDFNQTLSAGLRLVLFLVLPSCIGLIAFAQPIISLLYERGNFDAMDRMHSAIALQSYCLGLVFYAGLKVLQPAFYAIDKHWFPMLMSIAALIINLTFNYLFVIVLKLGHEYLALTTSISAMINFICLYLAMNHFVGSIQTQALFKLLAKLAFALTLMAAFCYTANRYCFQNLSNISTLNKLVTLNVSIFIAALIYLATSYLLKVEEMNMIRTLVARFKSKA